MKCTNSYIKFTSLITICCLCLTGCGSANYKLDYHSQNNLSLVSDMSTDELCQAFSENICVVTKDILSSEVDMENATSAVLFDINEREVLYAKNPHARLHPASLTKVLTALVALKYGNLSQTLTATKNVYISERGAQVINLKEGDTLTLEQALHILLMYSANDVALLIAENIGGTVDNFIGLMNSEAKALGATNSNFCNPHGLTDDNHYTTAYDLYLIFNEAVKYDKFTEIIQMTSYQTSITDKDGKSKDIDIGTTNLYLKGTYEFPENVTIIGGKTGTTNAAGHCLILLSKDKAGNPYISVILCSDARDNLYSEMTDLLNEIPK